MAATKMTASHERRRGGQVGLFFGPRGQPGGDRGREVGYALHESLEVARSGLLVGRVAHGHEIHAALNLVAVGAAAGGASSSSGS